MSRVPLLNFEEGPGSRVPGSRGPGSRNPGPTFTPCPVRSFLDLCNKIWILPFINIVFHFNPPLLLPSSFFIFVTLKLWNYLVQVLLVGFSYFHLSDYTSPQLRKHLIYWLNYKNLKLNKNFLLVLIRN